MRTQIENSLRLHNLKKKKTVDQEQRVHLIGMQTNVRGGAHPKCKTHIRVCFQQDTLGVLHLHLAKSTVVFIFQQESLPLQNPVQ